jgi:hypothetical protein
MLWWEKDRGRITLLGDLKSLSALLEILGIAIDIIGTVSFFVYPSLSYHIA